MGNAKIDLIDLIRRILHQWKLIVIVALVCGIIFEGIGYARAYLDYRQELQGAEAKEQEEEHLADQYLGDLEGMEKDLTEREITEAQTFATMYPVYLAQYEEELRYCQNAVKMQLDANQVPTYMLHYTTSEFDTDSQMASRIVLVLSDIIQSEAVCQEIRTALGWDTEIGYIEDLIDVETEGTLSSEDDSVLNILNSESQVTIKIQAPSKEECETIAGVIKTYIDQNSLELQDIYGEFEMTLFSETYVEQADNTLRSYQDGRYSALNTLRGAINSLTAGMTEDQKEYYYTLVSYNLAENGEEEPVPEEEETAEEESAEEENVVSPPEIIRWRFIILGLILGIILACGYIFIRYILAKNLRVKEDLEDTYHVPMLGYLPPDGKRQRFTREERMEMICAGIRVAIQKAGLKSVYLTGTAGDGESDQIMEQIEAALADSGAQISSGRDVSCDPASLEQMTASDGVVFVERIDRSPYADIQKEVELCQMYNVPVIGSVVIE